MFGAIGRILSKKAVNSMAELKKVENKDLMEAIVAASLLVAYADGSCGDDEILKLDELVRSNPALAHFGSEISQTINRISAQLKANFLVGRVHVKREIGDIKNNKQDAEEVFVNAIAMAQADGDISAEEKKVLQEIGREFGLRLEDYGLQG